MKKCVEDVIIDIEKKIESVKEPASLSERLSSMFGMEPETMGESRGKPLPMPDVLGGGKRKRKYKRSKHKLKNSKLKHSKLKKYHKRKKTLKRKYKKTKKKSKRR